MTANRIKFKSTERNRNDCRGFTLIELMFTVLILGVLLTIALPSYQRLVTSNRLTAQINELVGDLSLARSEAGARSRPVQVCIAASATSCASSGNDWAAGRIVWVDTDGNGSLDSATEILKYVPPLDGDVTMLTSGPLIGFLPYGVLAAPNNNWTFKLCSPDDNRGREVSVPFSGRAIAKRIENCP